MGQGFAGNDCVSQEPPDPLPQRNLPQLPAAAIERAYRETAADLRAFAWALTRDPPLADEVVQATFLRLAEKGHTADPATLRGWLFRVTANECFARRRRQARERRHLPSLADVAGSRQPESPAEAAARFEDIDRVRRALQALPAEQRAVVEQRIYGGKTFASIAEESGIPLGTLLGRMQAALRRLTVALAPRPTSVDAERDRD